MDILSQLLLYRLEMVTEPNLKPVRLEHKGVCVVQCPSSFSLSCVSLLLFLSRGKSFLFVPFSGWRRLGPWEEVTIDNSKNNYDSSGETQSERVGRSEIRRQKLNLFETRDKDYELL